MHCMIKGGFQIKNGKMTNESEKKFKEAIKDKNSDSILSLLSKNKE